MSYDMDPDVAREEIERLQRQLDRLEKLLIRKSEALAIVASPSMWGKFQYQEASFRVWRGADEFADPIAWAKRESEATEPYETGWSPGR